MTNMKSFDRSFFRFAKYKIAQNDDPCERLYIDTYVYSYGKGFIVCDDSNKLIRFGRDGKIYLKDFYELSAMLFYNFNQIRFQTEAFEDGTLYDKYEIL